MVIGEVLSGKCIGGNGSGISEANHYFGTDGVRGCWCFNFARGLLF